MKYLPILAGLLFISVNVVCAHTITSLPIDLGDSIEKVQSALETDIAPEIGHPNYDPKWAILHGVGAYQEPRNGDYLTNVDSAALWEEVLKTRCAVKAS